MNPSEIDMVNYLAEGFVQAAEANVIEEFLEQHGRDLPYSATLVILTKYFGIIPNSTIVLLPYSSDLDPLWDKEGVVAFTPHYFKYKDVPVVTPIIISEISVNPKPKVTVTFLSTKNKNVDFVTTKNKQDSDSTHHKHTFYFAGSYEDEGITSGIFELFLLDKPIYVLPQIPIEELK